MMSFTAGLVCILVAAVAGGAFGLQYRVMRRYTVANSSLLSLLFATVAVPLVAINLLLPGWTAAIEEVGWQTNLLVYLFGFGWGLGAITYAYGFNLLGMALAASLLKGITIAIGSGVPLIRHWDELQSDARTMTVVGLVILIVGTALAGRAGVLRERDVSAAGEPPPPSIATSTTPQFTRNVFLLGLLSCLMSGVLSSCANLGYEFADPLERAMGGNLAWRATLIRWMPMYWGGISALLIFMGGRMIADGTWRIYLGVGTARDFFVASGMGCVHFLAQIPYGIGAYYLGTLGTTVGWGLNIGMALIVAASIGFFTGEWRGVSRRSTNTLLAGIVVLVMAIGVLTYANSLNAPVETSSDTVTRQPDRSISAAAQTPTVDPI